MVETCPNTMADRLRFLLTRGELITMPCCLDTLSARQVEQAGFKLTFLSGIGASASRAPDLVILPPVNWSTVMFRNTEDQYG